MTTEGSYKLSFLYENVDETEVYDNSAQFNKEVAITTSKRVRKVVIVFELEKLKEQQKVQLSILGCFEVPTKPTEKVTTPVPSTGDVLFVVTILCFSKQRNMVRSPMQVDTCLAILNDFISIDIQYLSI